MLLRKFPFRSLSPAIHLRTKGVLGKVSLKPVDPDFRLSPEGTDSDYIAFHFVFLLVLCGSKGFGFAILAISAIMAIMLDPTPSFLVFVANKDASTNRPMRDAWVTQAQSRPNPRSAEGRKLLKNTKRNGLPLRIQHSRTFLPTPECPQYILTIANIMRNCNSFYRMARTNSYNAARPCRASTKDSC